MANFKVLDGGQADRTDGPRRTAKDSWNDPVAVSLPAHVRERLEKRCAATKTGRPSHGQRSFIGALGRLLRIS